MPPDEDALAFYATPGPMTDLHDLDQQIGDLPGDPSEVVTIAQGLVLHRFWAEAYGVAVPTSREGELQRRSARSMIERLMEMDPRPLPVTRPPEDRFLGNCRHFSVLTTALLRSAGIPARARCGFASYFEKGKWIDHWVVEHWNGDRWVMVDSQIDDFQRKAIGLVADPGDLPEGLFLTAGEAWMKARAGIEDAERFGILDMWGQWFIRGNVARDLAALNKVEMLPWDGWGTLARTGETECDDEYVDAAAALALSDDFAAVRHRYEFDPALHVPCRITSYLAAGPMEVDIPELAV
ncbi:MAG: transglutaminase-like domain-containing protein [Acidimicrobiales bacterium]